MLRLTRSWVPFFSYKLYRWWRLAVILPAGRGGASCGGIESTASWDVLPGVLHIPRFANNRNLDLPGEHQVFFDFLGNIPGQ